jgi:hypothetical protein
MRGRVWDATIVLLAAFSGLIIEYIMGTAIVPAEYKFILPLVVGLTIFLFGVFVSEVLFSTKLVRRHLFRDEHAAYIGYWIDTYQRTNLPASTRTLNDTDSSDADPPSLVSPPTNPTTFYSILRIYYSSFQKGYALSGVTFTSSGHRHAFYNSIVIIFPYQTERKEFRYQYIGTVY